MTRRRKHPRELTWPALPAWTVPVLLFVSFLANAAWMGWWDR